MKKNVINAQKTILTNNKESIIKELQSVNVPAFLDMWGPENVIQVYDSKLDMRGILVIDNTSLGPGKGGIRIGIG